MGLDMYIYKAKKIPGMTFQQLRSTDDYIEYLNRPMDRYADCTFKSWCGGNEELVAKDRIDEVKNNIHESYYKWDIERRYPRQFVFENVAYWRKANAIHNWIIQNCADGEDRCQYIPLHKEQLEELLDNAKRVKNESVMVEGRIKNGYTIKDGEEVPNWIEGKYIKDPSVAQELLPTTTGFFFGSTDYDEWYMYEIDNTIEQITEILNTTDFDNEYVVYEASW